MAQVQSAADARAAAQNRVRFELLAELVRKDLKAKYENSALGFVWSLANPLAVTGPADVPLWVMDSDPLEFGPDGIATVRFTVKELPPAKGSFAFAAALRDPVTKVTYDARRFAEAFLAVGDSARGIVEVAWTAEQVETPGEEERDRAAGDRRRSEL